MGTLDFSRLETAPGRALIETRILVILRGPNTERYHEVTEILIDEGVRCIEYAMTTPGTVDALRGESAQLPDQAWLGAGTVTSAAEAEAATDAGASFLIAPSTSRGMVRRAIELGVPAIPAGLTPSEVADSWERGASAVKLFPCAVGGPSYLRRLREPLPEIPLVPTGGIGIDNIEDYLAAGALAVGLGAPLIGDALHGGSLQALRERTRVAIAACVRAS